MSKRQQKRPLDFDALIARCEEEGNCHLWQQAITRNGYARLGVKGHSQYAHVAAWMLLNGSVPKGKQLGNCCGHRHCIWPPHWKPMTRGEQNLKAAAAGAWSGRVRAMRIAATVRGTLKLDEQKVAAIRLQDKSADEFAAEFGVDRSLIYRIWRGKAWAPLQGASAFTFRP